MTQFFSDAKDFVSDRIGSPFWLSTIVSWCIWNWKIPVTALFQTNSFTIEFLEAYFESTSIWYHLALPLVSGLLYATLSGSFRETLEIAAKFVHDKVAKIDGTGRLYSTISTEKHNKKVKRLERQIQRISEKIVDSEEIASRNDTLQSEIENRKSREQELIEIIREEAIEKSLDDSFRKLRFLQKLHEKGFGLTISEDDLEVEVSKEDFSHGITSEDTRAKGIFSENPEASKLKGQGTRTKKIQLGNELSNYKELQDPNAKATILMTLMLAKARNQIDQSIPAAALGLKENVFENCIQKLSKSNLAIVKNGKTLITASGNDRLNALRNELEQGPILSKVESMKDEIKNQIMQVLSENSFDQKDLFQLVEFHPDLPSILNELKRTGAVQTDGELLFGNNSTI
jgi:hypothetical protein